MPLSYKLTTFQIPGQKLSNFFVGILVETMTPRGHFEINWPLPSPLNFRLLNHSLWWNVSFSFFNSFKKINKKLLFSHFSCKFLVIILKVSWFQNVLLESSFRPKYQRKNLTISALEFEKWSIHKIKALYNVF